jgi:predicted 3-demethylubiquinone-9 3-methyltransferase (glyoxalase superfamily)
MLMFTGDADAAMRFYTSIFDDSAVTSVERYGPGQPGPEGTVVQATFRLAGQTLRCIDSPVPHAFGFTPALSLHVACDSAPEVDRLFAALSEGGQVLMPLERYPFAERFGWVTDRFGVSWQLHLVA